MSFGGGSRAAKQAAEQAKKERKKEEARIAAEKKKQQDLDRAKEREALGRAGRGLASTILGDEDDPTKKLLGE